jgi:hypothetical protein
VSFLRLLVGLLYEPCRLCLRRTVGVTVYCRKHCDDILAGKEPRG